MIKEGSGESHKKEFYWLYDSYVVGMRMAWTRQRERRFQGLIWILSQCSHRAKLWRLSNYCWELEEKCSHFPFSPTHPVWADIRVPGLTRQEQSATKLEYVNKFQLFTKKRCQLRILAFNNSTDSGKFHFSFLRFFTARSAVSRELCAEFFSSVK